jgi:uncharacterized protein YfaT (DUF1175 family)
MGLLIFAAVMAIIAVFILIVVHGVASAEAPKRLPPEQQLAARFARGEISEGEYLRSLAILQHGTDFVSEARLEPRPGDPQVIPPPRAAGGVEDPEQR